MVLISEAKLKGGVMRTDFGHHDFAARGFKQVARGGYFQTREVVGLGVTKYPLLAAASMNLSRRSYRALANELRVLSHPPLMSHENIVKLKTIGWTRLDPSGAAWMPMIFLELAELGTLTQYLSETRLGVDSKLRVAQDVGCGLQALHACGITHGDLKPDNVLMFKGESGEIQVKLSDFGCSYIAKDDGNGETMVDISAGTTPWNSPELHKQVPISWLPNVDTYSFGLLVWSVFINGRDPFEGLDQDVIDRRKEQDLILSDASSSLEDEYDKDMLLRGAISSHERTHLYMRGVAVPKRCFRHTMSSLIQNRDLNAGVDSLSLTKMCGMAASATPARDGQRLDEKTTATQFLRLFDSPNTARAMFFRSMQQAAADDGIPREVRANAYLQLCYANIDSFGTARDFAGAIKCAKAAASLGSVVAASVLRRLVLATGHAFDPALKDDLKRWLAKAVDKSILARKELSLLDDDPATLIKAEEPFRLFIGAKAKGREIADADRVKTMFLPEKLEVMRVLLGVARHPALDRLGRVTGLMSTFGNTYLHAGAALGVNPDHFRNVIAEVGAEIVNAQDVSGNTALHLAVRFENVEIAQALLERGADASMANKRGETPWHWLISLEEEDIGRLARLMMGGAGGLKAFAKARNSADDQYSVVHGGTPLHWAVDMRLRCMVTTLLDCGADPLLEYGGISPIDAAIKWNAAELLGVLLESVAESGRDVLPRRTLTDLMVMGGAAKSEVADDGEERLDTLLVQAVATTPLHERLIYGGRDWSADTISTLAVLQAHGHLPPWEEENSQARLNAFRLLVSVDNTAPDMMQTIIDTTSLFPGGPEDGVEGTAEAATTFWKAALKEILRISMPAMVLFVIDKVRKFSPSSRLDGADALLRDYCASLRADISVVESILKDCSSADCADEQGRTPLMHAVKERNFEIATYLLERGADVGLSWAQDGVQMYMLFEYTVNNTDVDVVPLKYLLEPMHPFPDKAPPFLAGPDNEDTVLQLACKDGNPVIVGYLLSKFGSEDQVNQRGRWGFTALHHAVYNGHADLVVKLCQAGADVNARSGTGDLVNRERSRPLDLCFRYLTQSEGFLAHKYGLERTKEDVLLGRLRIADFLKSHGARRADRFLERWSRSLALKFSLLAAEEGMTRLLAVTLRRVSKEMHAGAHGDVDYDLLLTNLLWVAATNGHVGAVRLLLSLGADSRQRSASGLSLLHIVSRLGKAEMVNVLTKHGDADINSEDAAGVSVCMYALMSGNVATFRMVKSLGGYVTIEKSTVESIIGFPLPFNLHLTVRVGGEPSDDEISDDEISDHQLAAEGEQ